MQPTQLSKITHKFNNTQIQIHLRSSKHLTLSRNENAADNFQYLSPKSPPGFQVFPHQSMKTTTDTTDFTIVVFRRPEVPRSFPHPQGAWKDPPDPTEFRTGTSEVPGLHTFGRIMKFTLCSFIHGKKKGECDSIFCLRIITKRLFSLHLLM